MYYVRMVLDNSLSIFDDLVLISELSVIALIQNEETRIEWDHPVISFIVSKLFPNVDLASSAGSKGD